MAFIRSSGICRMVNAEYVTQLVRSHQSGKKDYSRKIWNLYVLAQWYTTFVENFK